MRRTHTRSLALGAARFRERAAAPARAATAFPSGAERDHNKNGQWDRLTVSPGATTDGPADADVVYMACAGGRGGLRFSQESERFRGGPDDDGRFSRCPAVGMSSSLGSKPLGAVVK